MSLSSVLALCHSTRGLRPSSPGIAWGRVRNASLSPHLRSYHLKSTGLGRFPNLESQPRSSAQRRLAWLTLCGYVVLSLSYWRSVLAGVAPFQAGGRERARVTGVLASLPTSELLLSNRRQTPLDWPGGTSTSSGGAQIWRQDNSPPAQDSSCSMRDRDRPQVDGNRTAVPPREGFRRSPWTSRDLKQVHRVFPELAQVPAFTGLKNLGPGEGQLLLESIAA